MPKWKEEEKQEKEQRFLHKCMIYFQTTSLLHLECVSSQLIFFQTTSLLNLECVSSQIISFERRGEAAVGRGWVWCGGGGVSGCCVGEGGGVGWIEREKREHFFAYIEFWSFASLYLPHWLKGTGLLRFGEKTIWFFLIFFVSVILLMVCLLHYWFLLTANFTQNNYQLKIDCGETQ